MLAGYVREAELFIYALSRAALGPAASTDSVSIASP